jgi:signal transduction histidine kinase
MTTYYRLNRILASEYCGQIIDGDYTMPLKKQVAAYISSYRAFEGTRNPAMPYISAWVEPDRGIWYEFVSARLLDLLSCEPEQVAEVLRNSIVDRHIYKYMDTDAEILKETVSRNELNGSREELREDVRQKGVIDAVYKLSLENDRTVWLKDMAVVETYERDRICLSLGNLTIVSKEMKAEEERVQRERLQATLEMAGAVCDELNQPLQSISAHSEILLMHFSDKNPLYGKIEKVVHLTKQMGKITKKLMRITKLETKDYVQGVKIVDIDKSAS